MQELFVTAALIAAAAATFVGTVIASAASL
jgi:hypothetical protein